MARQLRIDFPGAIHHVTVRGNRRETVFRHQDERLMFYELLTEVVRDYNWVCHADCQMGNHYHLCVGMPEANLSAGMRQLNGVFTQRLNRSRGTVGHVFQGRFWSRVVEGGDYFLRVCRYTVLNPVRAGLAARPEDWRWSSHRGTAGLDRQRKHMFTGTLLDEFAGDPRGPRAAWSDFVKNGAAAPSPFSEGDGAAIGGGEFVRAVMRKMREAPPEVPKKERLAGRPSLEEIASPVGRRRAERDAAILAAWREHGYTMADIAKVFGVHYSTVNRIKDRLGSSLEDGQM